MNIKTFKKHKKTYLKKMEKKENREEELSNSKPQLIIIQNKKYHFKSKENTLQDNFKSFRKHINQIRKENKKSKKYKPLSFKDNPNRIKELREKFVETAHSLIGTPYGKKYLIKQNIKKIFFRLLCINSSSGIFNE